MEEKEHIKAELEELGAGQLRALQGRLSRPGLSRQRLEEIAAAARADADMEAKVRTLRPRTRTYGRWAIAATIALLVGVTLWILPNQSSSEQIANLKTDALSETTILAYVEANIDEFEFELLEDVIEEEETFEVAPLNVLPDTAIESYLETTDDWLEDVY